MKRTQEPRADDPAGGPSVNAAAGGMEIERLLFDHMSDAVFATDLANRVTHWTASAERMFGYTAGEAVGRSFGELLPFQMARPSDEREFFTELEAGRTWRGTGIVRLRDGSEMWLESSVQPILADGRPVGRVSVARDISATVEVQRRLADQERFIDAVLDVAGALVLVLDAQGRRDTTGAGTDRASRAHRTLT